MSEEPLIKSDEYFNNLNWDNINTPYYWFKNQPFNTHVINSINLLGVQSEHFIVKSLNDFKSSIENLDLLGRVESLIEEEYSHSLQVVRFYNSYKKNDYAIGLPNTLMRFLFKVTSKCFSKKMKLAMSVALEHHTHSLAKQAFEIELMPDNVSDIYDLMNWHFKEELAHKTLLMDVYNYIGLGYVRRVVAMLYIINFIILLHTTNSIYFIFKNRQRRVNYSDFLDLIKLVFGKKGLIRVTNYYFSIFKRQYKP